MKVDRCMKQALLSIPILLVVAALALGGCGNGPGTQSSTGSSVPATTVQLSPTDFMQTTRTIRVGQSLLFDDSVNGGSLHIICLGRNQVCSTSARGPAALMRGGFTIQPGTTKSVTFPTAGTYSITCTVHPNMNLAVVVR
jgi:hypothetical protein